MPSPFASVTRVAIEEIIREHTTDSKFGYFLTEDTLRELVEDLAGLMETSRSLKSAGDRILKKGTVLASPSGGMSRNKTP